MYSIKTDGMKPEQEGKLWPEALQEALQDPMSPVLLGFWSRAAAHDPVFCSKVMKTLQHLPNGSLEMRSLMLDLVLHLGHRRSQWDADVPAPW